MAVWRLFMKTVRLLLLAALTLLAIGSTPRAARACPS
jgi:hypothetical protein